MKLKIVEAKHEKREREVKYLLSFDKGNVLRVSKGLIGLMGLKAGDLISFIQDEESPKDWYLSKNLKGGTILRDSSDRTYLYGLNSGIRDRIDATIGVPGKSYTFRVASKPVDTVAYGEIYAVLSGTIKMSIRDGGKRGE